MSEKSLEQLIASLKTEAIEAAEKQAEKILTDANQKAQHIVQVAEEKKSSIITAAEKEAESIVKKGEAALRQAGRDYTISVRNELLHIFQLALESEIHQEFTPDLMKSAIEKVIDNIGTDVELLLSNDDAKELSNYIHTRINSSIDIVSIIEDSEVLKGFTITKKNQGWSYTISPEEIAEALKKHLNKNWRNILQKES